MGASLLSNPDTACDIIRTLSSSLSLPGECRPSAALVICTRTQDFVVTAKIRLLETIEDTIAFMRRLQEAGAAAITGQTLLLSLSFLISLCLPPSVSLSVHLRTKTTSSNSPANWDALGALVRSVSIPVIANGDVYTIADVEFLVQSTGCVGAMVGRVSLRVVAVIRFISCQPALLNPSLLSRPGPITRHATGDPQLCSPQTNSYIPVSSEQVECWKPLREVIGDFLEECVKYDPSFQVFAFFWSSLCLSLSVSVSPSPSLAPLQIVKYTIQEMMSQRRHCQERLVHTLSAHLTSPH
jgi:tRNA-dihydrouridine synthase